MKAVKLDRCVSLRRRCAKTIEGYRNQVEGFEYAFDEQGSIYFQYPSVVGSLDGWRKKKSHMEESYGLKYPVRMYTIRDSFFSE